MSPEAQAKAKENFKKRFGDYGAKRAVRLRDEIIHSSSSGGPPP